MKDANLSGLSPLWLISLALILGTFIVIAIPISIASGESIKASDWIGFAGSIAAGVMTLVAATLAWFAVQRQIKAQEVAEERATQRSTEQKAVQDAEAKYAAVIVLTQTVHAAAAALNVTTQYVDALQEHERTRKSLGIGLVEYGGGHSRPPVEVKDKLDAVMVQLKTTMSHFAVTEVWKDLGIEDKANYLVVTSTLHTVTNIHENPPPTLGNLALAMNQQGTLRQFTIYLRAFDAELADIYQRDSNI
jgi:hypothetical protein